MSPSRPVTEGPDGRAAGASSVLAANPLRTGSRWSSQALRRAILVASYVLMLLAFSVAADGFATTSNLQQAVNTAVPPALLALSVTVVLVMGQFDLSGPAVAALSAMVIALLVGTGSLHGGAGWVVAVVITLGIGMGAGAVNGFGVALGRASSFIVTLAVSSLAGGLELYFQSKIPEGGTTIDSFKLPSALQNFTLTTVGGFALYVPFAILVALATWLLMAKTTFGRHAHALGGNEVAARLAGLPVSSIKVGGFVVAGAIAAFVGIILVSRQGYFPNATFSYLLPAYAAAFFGAAAVGRRGFSVLATLFGVLYLETLSNGLQVLNQQPYVISLVQGGVLLVTVLVARSGSS